MGKDWASQARESDGKLMQVGKFFAAFFFPVGIVAAIFCKSVSVAAELCNYGHRAIFIMRGAKPDPNSPIAQTINIIRDTADKYAKATLAFTAAGSLSFLKETNDSLKETVTHNSFVGDKKPDASKPTKDIVDLDIAEAAKIYPRDFSIDDVPSTSPTDPTINHNLEPAHQYHHHPLNH